MRRLSRPISWRNPCPAAGTTVRKSMPHSAARSPRGSMPRGRAGYWIEISTSNVRVSVGAAALFLTVVVTRNVPLDPRDDAFRL